VLNSLCSIRCFSTVKSSAANKQTDSGLMSDPGPDARLLHRACCQASPGLHVSLKTPYKCEPDLYIPADLLQLGVESGGWTKVQHLTVRLPGWVSLH
jgi:hypothetical protein